MIGNFLSPGVRFRLISFFGLLLFFPKQNFAQQKQTTEVEQIWLAYFNQTRFSDRWGVWADGQFRTKDNFVEGWSSIIARAGLTWYGNDHLKFTLGYAYIAHGPGDNHANIARPEHRPWQQVQWHQNKQRVRFMQYVRLEERFRRKVQDNDALASGYNFNYRLRYSVLFQSAFGTRPFRKNTWAWALNNEVMLNFGKEIVYNYFDQNRFFAGLHFYTSDRSFIQAGYLNVFQQLSAGNRYRVTHAFRLFYLHNIDLRKKKQ